MVKIFLGVVSGVFLGALLLEILRRKNPKLAEEIEKRAKQIVEDAEITFG